MKNINNRTYLMEQIALSNLLSTINNVDLNKYNDFVFENKIVPKVKKTAEKNDNVAIIMISGVLLAEENPIYDYFQIENTVYSDICDQIDDVENDINIDKVIFLISSPGGVATFIDNLSDKILKMKKSTHAYVTDICASAAYWIASQCDTISCGRMSHIGSLGAYQLYYDNSVQYSNAGIRPVLVSGDGQIYKGFGAEGIEISEASLVPIKEEINTVSEIFLEYVNKKRTISKDLFLGRTWMGEESLTLGLVDKIESIDDFITNILTLKTQIIENKGLIQMEEQKELIELKDKSRDAATDSGPLNDVEDEENEEIKDCEGEKQEKVEEMEEEGPVNDEEQDEENPVKGPDGDFDEDEEEKVKVTKMSVLNEIDTYMSTFGIEEGYKLYKTGKSIVECKADMFDKFVKNGINTKNIVKDNNISGAEPFTQAISMPKSENPYEMAKIYMSSEKITMANALNKVRIENNYDSTRWTQLLSEYNPFK